MKYIDLDGVLVNLDKWLINIDSNGAKDEKTFNEIAIKYYDKLFIDSEPILDNFKLLNGEYRILSALPNIKNYLKYGLAMGLDYCDIINRHNILYNNKIEWCKKYNIIISNVIIVEARKLKSNYALSSDDILYDDSIKNIEEWEQAGGTGILVPYK